MKQTLLAVLSAGALTVLGSQAQAHDRYYEDDDRYERSGCRDVVRYERPRYYYNDEVVVRPRRFVVEEDYGCRPVYYRRHQENFFRIFFGGF